MSITPFSGSDFYNATELSSSVTFPTAPKSLTFGNSTTTQTVTNSAARTVAGDVKIYGGAISNTGSLTTTGSGSILLNSKGSIDLSGSLTTAGGYAYLYADSDNGGAGASIWIHHQR